MMFPRDIPSWFTHRARHVRSASDGNSGLRLCDDDFGLAPEGKGWRQANEASPHVADDVCLVCGAVQPRPAPLPRMACASCRARARVIGTDALLRDLVRPRVEGEFPLEGSLLAFLLNPIDIDGRRGWAEFGAGSWGVHEEVASSTHMFDFTLQHREPFRRWLRHVRARALVSAIEREGCAAVFLRLSEPARTNLEQLALWWGQRNKASRLGPHSHCAPITMRGSSPRLCRSPQDQLPISGRCWNASPSLGSRRQRRPTGRGSGQRSPWERPARFACGLHSVSDTLAVRRVLEALGGPSRVNLLLVGHSHFDHSLDTPTWSRFTGARIIGSRTTCLQATALQVPEGLC